MHVTQTTTLYTGKSHKASVFDTKQLKDKSIFLRRLLTETPEPVPEQTTFEDADEAGMALMQHWVSGRELCGPTDFHSMSHYLGCYALARRFGCEGLENRGKYLLSLSLCLSLSLSIRITHCRAANDADG